MPKYDYDWMGQAKCGPHQGDTFFPDEPGHGARRQIVEAANICRGCPVQQECSNFGTRTDTPFGVWAGGLQAGGLGVSLGGTQPRRSA